MDLQLLRQDLEKKGYTQERLAEKLNCHQSQISMIYSGKRRMRVEVLENICNILNMPPCKYLKGSLKVKLCSLTLGLDNEILSNILAELKHIK